MLPPQTTLYSGRMNEFRYISYAQEVIFGAGSVAQLGDAVESFHMRRLMLCTTRSLRRGGQIKLIEQALGNHIFDYCFAKSLLLFH